MNSERKIRGWGLVTACVAVLLFGNSMAGISQTVPEDDEVRKLWDTGFLQKRPATKSPAQPVRYKRVTPVGPAAGGDATQVGLTVWRLRPARATDDKTVRILIQEDRTETRWIPERIEADTPLREGQRVRLSIEVPRRGYLYVLDRETYANGMKGEPYLIFPTARTRGGDNAVSPGAVVEIPSLTDDPSYFTLKRSRPDQTGELLTVLVTTEPLPDVEIGAQPLRLNADQVAGWEKQWGVQTERIEMVGGAGKTYTQAEKEAALDRTRALTQGDPLPQTIYRLAAKQSGPLLLNVPLKINQK